MDFQKRSRWKLYQQSRTRPTQGRYLDVLDSPQPWVYAVEMATFLTWLRGIMLYSTYCLPLSDWCTEQSGGLPPSPISDALTTLPHWLPLYTHETNKDKVHKKVTVSAHFLNMFYFHKHPMNYVATHPLFNYMFQKYRCSFGRARNESDADISIIFSQFFFLCIPTFWFRGFVFEWD